MLGHPALVTPYNTSEFHAMLEQMRKHHRAMTVQGKAVVAELRPALAEIGTRIPFGADAKVNAYRVCRQLTYAAGLNLEAAAAYVHADNLYHQLFVINKKRGSRPKFDPTK